MINKIKYWCEIVQFFTLFLCGSAVCLLFPSTSPRHYACGGSRSTPACQSPRAGTDPWPRASFLHPKCAGLCWAPAATRRLRWGRQKGGGWEQPTIASEELIYLQGNSYVVSRCGPLAGLLFWTNCRQLLGRKWNMHSAAGG